MIRYIRFQEKFRDDVTDLLADVYGVPLASIKNDMRDSGESFILAVDGETVVGVLGFFFDWSHYANFVEDLAVSKEYQRRGIASSLLSMFVEVSKASTPGRQRLCLSSTTTDNEASITLHIKCGFERLGVLKKLHFGKDEVFFGHRL